MEEELNEDELEERLYAMIHYADDTQTSEQHNDPTVTPAPPTQAPSSTLRRYWRTSTDLAPTNTTYHKVNAPNPTPLPSTPQTNIPKPNNTVVATVNLTEDEPTTKPKEERQDGAGNTSMLDDMCLLNGPISKDTKITVQILENDDSSKIVELETSDEDEVVEVALPPKPTITIESSEDEESAVEIIPAKLETTNKPKKVNKTAKDNPEMDREVSASPVPSIVSSVSDDFIRGDCIALNISSRQPVNHSFDFSLHGADLTPQSTPSKAKKKKKKNKDQTPTASLKITDIVTPEKPSPNTTEGYFATPKSKTKKKQKNKIYKVAEKSIPNPDVYDSDSNNSIDVSKKQTYTVTDKSCPNADLYESDSSQSLTKDSNDSNPKDIIEIPDDEERNEVRRPAGKENQKHNTPAVSTNINENQDSPMEENIVIANVIGFKDFNDDYYSQKDNNEPFDESMLGSTKVPPILFEDLDFDFLKGKGSGRRFSLETLRTEMQKFYNDSWGGENFNHMELQKTMSRDKSLWEIDPKDMLPLSTRRKITCHYCGRLGHRDDTCRLKPAVCHMCGTQGHYETRCPNKICVNCGSPNGLYSAMCKYCAGWSRGICAECGQRGHPSSHCPDLWRRYHNTIDNNTPLEEVTMFKRFSQLYCSGCSRRGHLVHTCRMSGLFGSLPVNSPYVFRYQPLHAPSPTPKPYQPPRLEATPKKNKRQSKSPSHETHLNKKRFEKPKERRNSNRMSFSDSSNTDGNFQKGSKEKDFIKVPNYAEAYADGNKASSSNTDKNGQVIQDNQVSDTSTVSTVARIYITKEIADKLKTEAGEQWLQEKVKQYNLEFELLNTNISIKGVSINQDAFQNDLREWTNKDSQPRPNSATSEHEDGYVIDNIPKKKHNALRQLNKAFEMLEEFHGEPKALHKELNFHLNHREKLLKQKIISPKQLANNRDSIRGMTKKLNMVLLGQAGLADGPAHLSKLKSMLGKLIDYRNKTVPIEMRKEIGQHYNCIFTPLPRDDYANLVSTYYSRASAMTFNKVKKIKKKPKKFVNPFSEAMSNTFNEMIHKHKALKSKNSSDFLSCTMQGAGESYKQLMKCKPGTDRDRKARVRIARLLHDEMAKISNKQGDVSMNQLKNVRQVTERVNAFMRLLTN